MPARLFASRRFKFFFSIVFSLILFVIQSSSLITPAYAQTNGATASTSAQVTTPSSDEASASSSLNITTTSPQYANLLVINLIHAFSCFAEGRSIIGQPCITLTPDPGNSQGMVPSLQTIAYNGGALGAANNFITDLYYTPPVRTSEYLASEFNNFGLATPAFAQVTGSGNDVLQPILVIWQVSRNIAYLGMTIILVVIGLLIMFRQKVNPQTVISAQAALPGIVIGLVLITFSYFFAALLVDLTFVSTHLVGHVLEGQIIRSAAVPDDDPKNPGKTIDPVTNLLKNYSILSIYNFFIDGGGFTNGKAGQKGTFVDPTNVIGETQAVVSSLQRDHTLGAIIAEASGVGGCIVANQVGYESAAQKGLDIVATAIEAAGGAQALGTGGEGAADKDVIESAGRAAIPAVANVAKTETTQVVKKATVGTAGRTAINLGSRLGLCALGGSLAAWLASSTGIVGDLAGLLLYLVLMIALLIAMFRLLFALIGAYLSVMISTITAPLQFLIGSIPGRGEVVNRWFKGMIGNLLAFPAVFAALIFAAFIINWGNAPFYISTPTSFTAGTLPLLGGLSSNFLRLVLAYGVLLVTPQIPQMVKGALGVKDSFDFSKAVLGGAGAGFGVIKAGASRLTKNYQQERKLSEEFAQYEKVFGSEAAKTKFGGYVRPAPWELHKWVGIKGITPISRGRRQYIEKEQLEETNLKKQLRKIEFEKNKKLVEDYYREKMAGKQNQTTQGNTPPQGGDESTS